MDRIDAQKASQVWQRVLAGRDGIAGSDQGLTSQHFKYTGDLPPVRITPPGMADWKTYNVFPARKQKQPSWGRTSPSPLLVLLFALLIISRQSPETHRITLPKKPDEEPPCPPSSR